MKITNHSNLPDPLVNAIRNDPYHAGGSDITVTALIRPARQVALQKQFDEEIEEDASERIWALIGQIGHSILQRGSQHELTEHRMFGECNGWKISGQADVIHPETLIDYKFTSVWGAKDGIRPEWEQQCNLLILLGAMNDVPISRAQIVAIYRDWSKLEARRNPDYPIQGVGVFDIPVWERNKAEAFLAERVLAHQIAR